MTSASGEPSAWIRRFHAAPSAPTRLVCLPHAGGSASYFFPVATALTPGVEVLAVQYPGRQDRRTETCVDDLHELADHVARELKLWSDRPVTLFGHSMGAVLAYEVARRLRGSDVELLGVLASGRGAPSRARVHDVHLMRDDMLLREVRALSGTEDKLFEDDEIVRMVLPALRSDYKAVETYRHDPDDKLSCPVVALLGDDDPRVSEDEARAWEDHTDGEFGMRVFPGGHFYLNDQAEGVLSVVTEHIAKWSAAAGRAG
ncbi:thioesterase II family protein [Streptomyces sp. 1268]|uniref:thioesterase II family protein n=1 Tax=Streptomyces sp. 1268 TaxID=3231942 RepID=UPI0038D4B669